MEKKLVLKTIDQIKAISHPYRMSIIKSFSASRKPMSVKMIADEMDETPSKIHYHLKELVKNDILELVKTREINGILEKFYFPVAENITIEKELLTSEYEDSGLQILIDMLDSAKEDIVKVINDEDYEEKSQGLGFTTRLYLTNDEMESFREEVASLLEKYDSHKSKNRKPYDLLHLLYPIK